MEIALGMISKNVTNIYIYGLLYTYIMPMYYGTLTI